MGLQIPGKMVADRTISAVKSILASITGSEIAENTIDSSHLKENSIKADQIDQTAIDKVLDSKYVFTNKVVLNFTTSSATSDDVTSEVLSALTNINTDGSNSKAGAVTSGTRCSLIDYDSGDKIFDNGDEIYCELSETEEELGITNWVNGQNTIFMTGTPYGEIGDFVRPQSQGGSWYEIIGVSAATMTLDRTFDGANDNDRVVKLALTNSYYKDVSNVKTAFTMDGRAISFKFKESMTLKDAPSDSLVSGNSSGDVAPLGHDHNDIYTKTSDLQKTASGDSGGNYVNIYNTGFLTSPVDNSVQAIVDSIDAAISGGTSEDSYTNYPQYEVVASENVMPALDHTPKGDAYVQVWVNGKKSRYTDHYTFSAGVGTWLPGAGNADYTLAVGDTIEYLYPVLESSL
jgi:hypothetical protein